MDVLVHQQNQINNKNLIINFYYVYYLYIY
jgi:hypothetical protein